MDGGRYNRRLRRHEHGGRAQRAVLVAAIIAIGWEGYASGAQSLESHVVGRPADADGGVARAPIDLAGDMAAPGQERAGAAHREHDPYAGLLVSAVGREVPLGDVRNRADRSSPNTKVRVTAVGNRVPGGFRAARRTRIHHGYPRNQTAGRRARRIAGETTRQRRRRDVEVGNPGRDGTVARICRCVDGSVGGVNTFERVPEDQVVRRVVKSVVSRQEVDRVLAAVDNVVA